MYTIKIHTREVKAAQATGCKNSENIPVSKNTSMSSCAFFCGWLLELFCILLAPFQIMCQHHRLSASLLFGIRDFFSNTWKNSGLSMKLSTGGKDFYNSVIALVLVFINIIHKMHKHKLFLPACVYVFIFCQYCHPS